MYFQVANRRGVLINGGEGSDFFLKFNKRVLINGGLEIDL